MLEIQQELSETGSFQGIAQCWRCTEATSYEDCATHGKIETCAEDAECYIEARIRSASVRRFTTGCKLANACNDLKNQNFRGPKVWNQCKPENHQEESDVFGESVCRQCFRPCVQEKDASRCFQTTGENLGIPNWDDFGTTWDVFGNTTRWFWTSNLPKRQSEK
ncbi:Oidioi.mRNA.OKI2018_I69.chr1.g239.t1.cds [Oikopleura dioica]|uniref:Oidioi.mRNA.OKI2018_I69.chr1.g239.t1.cds n=1 Tax=Oikopleura dioica TaxID=34765 RepID=A0ABN7SMY4_OIKDI|nr:Oidioi.mRNA.OKI2018_I69.chr1.g239.t1.cds [Oikopleura dioica]